MNRNELESAALAAADRCLENKGHIALVDVFMEMGKLTQSRHDDWRTGRTPCLESIIQLNLSQINLVCRAVHRSAAKGGLKASWTAYVKWGKGNRTPLRFTKSGDPKLERLWATHYLPIRAEKRVSGTQTIPEPPTGASPAASANDPR